MFFKNSFDNMTTEETALLEKYFCGYDYQASTHTFIANYIWKDTHHITWEIIGDYLCLLGMGTLETEEKEYFMSFPLTRNGRYDLESLRYTIDTARAKFDEAGVPFEISMIPEPLAHLLPEIYGDSVVVTHDRDEAFRMCGRLGVMNHGRMETVKETKALFSDPETRTAAGLVW